MVKSHCNNRPVQPWPSCPVNGRTKEQSAETLKCLWRIFRQFLFQPSRLLHRWKWKSWEGKRGGVFFIKSSSLALSTIELLRMLQSTGRFHQSRVCLRAALSASLKLWSGGRWGGKSSVEDHRSSRLQSWHCHRAGKNKSKTIEAALLPVKTNYHKISPVNKLMASCLQRKAGQRFTLIITCLLYRYWQY